MRDPRRTNPSDVVARGYDCVVDEYKALESPDAGWPRMRWLEDLLARLPGRSRVLDLGCASGEPVAVRVARDHQFTGVDLSAVQIGRARRLVSEGTFICGDILEVAFPPGSFDAVVSFYTLDHIPRERHAALLGRIHEWLIEGGLLALSVEDSDQPGAVAEWLGNPMFFSHYDAATTLRLVVEAGFELLAHEVQTQVEGGVEIPYLFVLAHKRDR